MAKRTILMLTWPVIALVMAASASTTRTVADIIRPKFTAPGRIMQVGNQQMHIYCMGAGPRTVILESGMGESWATWSRVMPEVAAFARVCAYDRAGYGWSGAASGDRTAARLASELRALLVNAGIRGGIVLVAHSYGAYVARMYAAQYPGSLRGVVLVDPAHEDEPPMRTWRRRLHNMVPPTAAPELILAWRGESGLPFVLRSAPAVFQRRFLAGGSWEEQTAERGENDALPETRNQVRAAGFPGDLPLTVLTAAHIVTTDTPGKPYLDVAPLHFQLQSKLAALSAVGRQITAPRSGHLVQIDQPELVIDAIRDFTGGAPCGP